MKLVRKLCLTAAGAILGVSMIGMAVPASADTSWGCGGLCRSAR